jgi:hypothetical protein
MKHRVIIIKDDDSLYLKVDNVYFKIDSYRSEPKGKLIKLSKQFTLGG